MTDASPFSKLVPGFDFLQGLVKNAGAALPGIGQWVAPTLDPAELQKRIEELRTVQFWLEQNARMLATTIQALEVQRMTLSTLKTMNVQMEDLRESMQIRTPAKTAATSFFQMPGAAEPAAAKVAATPPASSGPANADGDASESASASASASPAPAPGVVDPLQWWGALTKQFTELATTAMKDGGMEAVQKVTEARLKAALDPLGGASAVPPAKSTTGTARRAAPARKAAAKKVGARR